tara:strand:- start:766 stop:969 length:204 start_codon:yes stop_codon:yes gene_type:complete
MKKKKLNELSLNKNVISKLNSSKITGGNMKESEAYTACPEPSKQTYETCQSIGTQCGGLTHDYFCHS